jgi:hypothetical protein
MEASPRFLVVKKLRYRQLINQSSELGRDSRYGAIDAFEDRGESSFCGAMPDRSRRSLTMRRCYATVKLRPMKDRSCDRN